jgi:pimeloyl-ACP methyl ester carboxylesterase
MRDGRLLAYRERGDPSGLPIVHHHGMPGSRLQHEADDEFYRARGVRVITPDRPGYGVSDPLPGRTLADWPRDVADLMDAIGIPRFGVTALSGGGIYALACAALLSGRLTGVAVAGCPAPVEMPGATEGMRPLTRLGVVLGSRAPWALEATGRVVGGVVRAHPRFVFDRSNRHKGGGDVAWLSQPSVASGAIDDLREGLRHGTSGYVRDVELLSSPWGFDPANISVAVDLWHGDADSVIPASHSRYLAAIIPRASLHICPGEGHMLLWNHLAEVLDEASGRLALQAHA